jgi:glycyl-tRNA synthetase beta chain
VELLLEIGTEEIPPSYIRPALEDLRESVRGSLENAGVDCSGIRVLGTPRRLVLILTGLAERAENKHQTVFGPPADRAYDETGKPTQAATGFAASQNVDVADLKIAKKGKGDYVCIDRVEKGAATRDNVLPILRSALSPGGMRFPKTMKWEAEGVRFARPIRWLTYIIDGRPGTDTSGGLFTWAGLTAGATTRGHRFLGAGEIKVASAEQYLRDLERNFVIVDHEKRKEMVRQRIAAAAAEAGGRIVEDRQLLERVTFTVEYPLALLGSFAPRFLEMPNEVVVTALREHQDFFSVADSAGRLLPNFVAVANMDEDREGKIKAGNERVLKARLDDAHFYWNQDLKDGLDKMAERLPGVTWQEQLGTLAEKSERVGRLAEHLADVTRLSSKDRIRRASELLKADLTSEMVREKEFSSLQGLMGREYALAAGEDREVAAAIFEHYLPRFAGDVLPETPTGRILAVADKLDSIVGCFGVGLIPTGSQDPYALRRQGTGIVRILVEKQIHLDLEHAAGAAAELLSDKVSADSQGLVVDVGAFLMQRTSTYLQEAGYRNDIVDSVAAQSLHDPLLILEKVDAIRQFGSDPRFGILITVFKRAFNITVAHDGGEVVQALLGERSEIDLFKAYMDTEPRFHAAMSRGGYRDAMKILLELAEPVNVFFDEVMVMVEDTEIKQNRLNLLGKITGLFLEIADFSKMDVS